MRRSRGNDGLRNCQAVFQSGRTTSQPHSSVRGFWFFASLLTVASVLESGRPSECAVFLTAVCMCTS